MGFSVIGRKACIVAAFLASASVALAASPASASTAQFGTISGVYGTSNGAILFATDGARTTAPACQAAGAPQRFAIDASTTAGQAAASLLLTAYSLHRKVFVQGMGACGIWSDAETVSYILMADS